MEKVGISSNWIQLASRHRAHLTVRKQSPCLDKEGDGMCEVWVVQLSVPDMRLCLSSFGVDE